MMKKWILLSALWLCAGNVMAQDKATPEALVPPEHWSYAALEQAREEFGLPLRSDEPQSREQMAREILRLKRQKFSVFFARRPIRSTKIYSISRGIPQPLRGEEGSDKAALTVHNTLEQEFSAEMDAIQKERRSRQSEMDEVPPTHWVWPVFQALMNRGVFDSVIPIEMRNLRNRPMNRYEFAVVLARLDSQFESENPSLLWRGDQAQNHDLLALMCVEFGFEIERLGVRQSILESRLE